MARVTVEDCLQYVDNRFLLVHVAAQRSKELFKGSYPLVKCKNKEVVTALREIASGYIQFSESKAPSEAPTSPQPKLGS